MNHITNHLHHCRKTCPPSPTFWWMEIRSWPSNNETYKQKEKERVWRDTTYSVIKLCTIIWVGISAIHRSVRHGYDPWLLGPILWFICILKKRHKFFKSSVLLKLDLKRMKANLQISFQPIILRLHLWETEFKKIVKLRAEWNDVHRSHIKAVEEIIFTAKCCTVSIWHIKSMVILSEITFKKLTNFNYIEIQIY